MSRENEKRRNVRRLAYCLCQMTGNPALMQQLARVLHYVPEQLQRDINDLEEYTYRKVKEDDAAAEDD